MQVDRVLDLPGDPHEATRPVLLEVDFVHRPVVPGGIGVNAAGFFVRRRKLRVRVRKHRATLS